MTRVVQILQSSERYTLLAPRLILPRRRIRFGNVYINHGHTGVLLNSSGNDLVIDNLHAKNTLNIIDDAGGNDVTLNRVRHFPPKRR